MNIIVGAGVPDLGAAKFFLQCQPHLNLLIIDAKSSIGGVWARENIYLSLETKNIRGTMDFSDFSVSDEFRVKAREHLPRLVMHEYLTAYARKWHMTDQLVFDTMVKVLEITDGFSQNKWTSTVEECGQSGPTHLKAAYRDSRSGSKTNSKTDAEDFVASLRMRNSASRATDLGQLPQPQRCIPRS